MFHIFNGDSVYTDSIYKNNPKKYNQAWQKMTPALAIVLVKVCRTLASQDFETVKSFVSNLALP